MLRTISFKLSIYYNGKVKFILWNMLAILLILTILQNETHAQLICTFEQLTDTKPGEGNVGRGINSSGTVISSDGTKIAFLSNANLTDENPDKIAQLFFFDRSSSQITQLTNGNITDESNCDFNHSISADGSKIVFECDRNINGENPNERRQIYLYDTITSSVTKITNNRRGSFPSISADGTKIGFSSNEDFTGENSEEVFEIFLYDILTKDFKQITNTPDEEPTFSPALNFDGTKLLFQSLHDFVGMNRPLKFRSFLYDVNNTTYTEIASELNLSPPGVESPLILLYTLSTNGMKAIFLSYSGDLIGENPEIIFQWNLYDINTTENIEITSAKNELTSMPSMSADGNRVAFQSSADITGENPDLNNQIFLFDVNTNKYTQITNNLSVESALPSINSTGTLILFSSEADLTGGNPDGNVELYLADCSNADLLIDISGTSVQDDKIEYNYSIANSGPQDATGVELVDILPTNAEFVSAESSQGTCQPSEASATTSEIIARQTGGTVTCDMGTLAVGDTVEVEIVITPIDTDQIQNIAEVFSDIPDTNTDNNSVTTTIVVEPPTRNSGGCELSRISDDSSGIVNFTILLMPILLISVRAIREFLIGINFYKV